MSEAEMAHDEIILGLIEFVRSTRLPSSVIDPMPREEFETLPRLRLDLREGIYAIETAIFKGTKLSVRIVGGFVRTGSIVFKDGKIVVTSPTLAAILVAGTFIASYEDLRGGIIALTADIQTAVSAIVDNLEMLAVDFSPADPDSVAHSVIPHLPPREYEAVTENDDRNKLTN